MPVSKTKGTLQNPEDAIHTPRKDFCVAHTASHNHGTSPQRDTCALEADIDCIGSLTQSQVEP